VSSNVSERQAREVAEAARRVPDGRYRWLEEGILDPSGEGPMIPDEVRQSPTAVPTT
jgi:hypothetical protein